MFTLLSMPNPRRLLGIFLLLTLGILVLSGCAPRPTVGLAVAQAAEPAPLVVDLPPLAIAVDETGVVSISNVPLAPRLAALHAAMRPSGEMQAHHDEMTAQLAALTVPSAWVDFVQQSNLQHLQVNTTPGGLLLLANGDPLLSLAWDASSLRATAQALALLGVPAPATLEKVLPLAQQVGVGVLVHFPPRAGETALPLYGQGALHGAAEVRQAQAEFLHAVGAPPRIRIPIIYQVDGSFSLGTLSEGEWTALTGLPWSSLQLDPALLARLHQAGVEQVSLRSDAAGIRVAVNGEELPALTWADGEVAHLVGVMEQLALGERWVPGADWEVIYPLIRRLLPAVQSAEVALTIFLPPSPPTAVAAR